MLLCGGSFGELCVTPPLYEVSNSHRHEDDSNLKRGVDDKRSSVARKPDAADVRMPTQ